MKYISEKLNFEKLKIENRNVKIENGKTKRRKIV
jgi:hypothetical protein